MPLDPQHGPRRAVESFCPCRKQSPVATAVAAPLWGAGGNPPREKTLNYGGSGGIIPPDGARGRAPISSLRKNSPSRLKGKVCDTAPMPRKTRAGLTEHDAPSSPLHPQHGPRRAVESFSPCRKQSPVATAVAAPLRGAGGNPPREKKLSTTGVRGGLSPPTGHGAEPRYLPPEKNSPYPSPRLLRGRGLRWRGWRRTGVWDGRGGRGRHWS